MLEALVVLSASAGKLEEPDLATLEGLSDAAATLRGMRDKAEAGWLAEVSLSDEQIRDSHEALRRHAAERGQR